MKKYRDIFITKKVVLEIERILSLKHSYSFLEEAIFSFQLKILKTVAVLSIPDHNLPKLYSI